MSSKSIGKIDERGYLNGFHRRGYTHPRSLLEIVANILDALDEITSAASTFNPTGTFDITADAIRILDNGLGMAEVDVEDMFALHRENNGKRRKRASRGVSGIGAKAALCILSNRTTVHLFTRKAGGDYLHVTVPWEDIFSQGRYTGMVTIKPMTESEKSEFIRAREACGMMNGTEAHGTTIVFKYNDKLAEVIRQNFKQIRHGSSLTYPMDRIDIVFGKETTNFVLCDYEQEEAQDLSLYDYFKGTQANFYKGVSKDVIEHYRKGDEDRFIWVLGEQQWEIVPKGAGWSREPEEMKRGLGGYRHVGDFEVYAGMRVDHAIFNPSDPTATSLYDLASKDHLKAERMVDSYSGLFLTDEDSSLDKDSEEYLLNAKIVRNGQRIGLIAPEIVKVGNARANSESRFKIEYVQCEVSFNPISTQDNPQDHVMGVQENKNQLNGSAIPRNLTRLIEAIKKRKADQIWEFIRVTLRAAEADLQEDDSDSEEEEEDEEETDDDNDSMPPLIPVVPAPVVPAPARPQPEVEPSAPGGGEPREFVQLPLDGFLNHQEPIPVRGYWGAEILTKLIPLMESIRPGQEQWYTDEKLIRLVDLLNEFEPAA